MPPTGRRRARGQSTQLPGFLHEPFAAAMSQSLLLPAFIALFGVVAAMFLLGFGSTDAPNPRAEAVDEHWDHDGDVVDDDDDYVEFTVVHDERPPVATAATPVPAPFVGAAAPVAPVVDTVVEPVGDESDTEPIPEVVRAELACRPGGAARPSTRARAQPVRLSRRRATAETVG